jgi:hypothetical protein
MARQKNIEGILNKSGHLSDVSEIHMSLRSEFETLQQFGIDVSPYLCAMDTLEKMSPDKRRLSKKEALQLVQDTPVLIPSVGTLPMIPHEDIGRIAHMKRAIFGEPRKGDE